MTSDERKGVEMYLALVAEYLKTGRDDWGIFTGNDDND